MISKFRLRLLFLFLPSLLLLQGCGKGESQKMPEGPPPASITAAAATQHVVPLFIDEIGRCAASETVSIQPQAAGRITEVHFKDGAEVKKGDKLFSIDPRPFQVALQQAEADMASNQAELARAEASLVQEQAALGRGSAGINESQARLALSKLEFDRAKELVKADAVARQQFDEKQMGVAVSEAQLKSSLASMAMANAQVRHAEAEVAVSRAKLDASQSAIAQAKLNLEYTTVLAPIDGRVGQRLMDVGNVVSSTFNPVSLVVLQRVDPIYADFSIPEAELARVRSFMAGGTLKVEVRAADAPDRVHMGELSFYDNAVQHGTGTIKLRATMQNPDRALWAGQFVKVRLILTQLKDAVLVPVQAVQVGQAGKFVYAVKPDSTVEMRVVKLGQRHTDQVVVNEGLQAGERIVVTGHLTLFPGAKVQEKSAALPASSLGTAKNGAPVVDGKDAKNEKSADGDTP